MALLGHADSTGAVQEKVAAAVPIVATMAYSYTRGRGFHAGVANPDIAAAVITATARLVSNSEQVSRSNVMGPITEDVRSYFQGWNLAELSVLNRYRVRAQ
ncbi:hypothetical protein F0Q45_18595 [Mycobacterium simiae]|uniref:Uncharacterized protein n=2 Tax=Mycobacterium simiae TaxID=1784 RepID=A0A5B1BJH1_MYCSI|nr:hypothetical protein F0Q45_18595 [Mycobacterium simiae]